MLIIGDVFAIIASIVFICLSIWATILASSLLFSNKVKHAQTSFETKPGAVFGIGFAILLFTVVTYSVMFPFPLLRLVGTAGLALVLSIGLMGAGGLAKVLGNRISPLDPNVSEFKNLARGAGLMVVLTLVPIVGWFFLTPLMIIMSLGAGFMSLFSKVETQPYTGPQFDARS